MKVQAILAGIITMTGLYTINLWAMGGRADLPLLKVDTIFTYTQAPVRRRVRQVCDRGADHACGGGAADPVPQNAIELSIRATGDNRDMVAASSIDPAFTITVGLCRQTAARRWRARCWRSIRCPAA